MVGQITQGSRAKPRTPTLETNGATQYCTNRSTATVTRILHLPARSATRSTDAAWLLALLHLLDLLGVCLLHLLGLLLVLLLQLLAPHRISLLSRQLLMFVILLLLQLLALLVLRRDHLRLLLLVFLIQCRISGPGGGVLDGR